MNKSISIATKILGPFYENEIVKENYWRNLELYMDNEEIDEIILHNKLLINIVKRCLKESFAIQDYYIDQIPYKDKNGLIFCFIHTNDFRSFEQNKLKITEVKCIDFFIGYDGNVTPMSLTYSDREGFNQVEKQTCKDALYYAFD